MEYKISNSKSFLNNNKQSLIKLILIVGFFVPTFFINYLFLFQPSVLNQKLKKFKNEKPKILRRVQGSILGDKLDIHVIKIKHKDKIYLDFLSPQEDGNFHLIDSIVLNGNHDGFFEYWDDALSLALLDDNGDGLLEVIAPTFDKFLKPHLNVIFYNKQTKKFQLKSFLESKPKIY